MSQKFTIIGTKSILFAMNYRFHSVSQMKYNYIIRTATMQVSASIGYDKALIGAKSGDFAQRGAQGRLGGSNPRSVGCDYNVHYVTCCGRAVGFSKVPIL